MKRNKDRKKDISLIQYIINDNQYHPIDVKVKFDKNNSFYEVKCYPKNPKKDQHDVTVLSQKTIIELMKNGLLIIKILFDWHHPTMWTSSGDYKISELVFSLHLRIGRDDEKYLWSSYEY